MSFDSSRSGSSFSKRRGLPVSNPWSVSARREKHKKDAAARAPSASATADSPVSSDSLSRKSPFSDFTSYMVEKNRKLREQFDAESSTSSVGDGERRDFVDNNGDKGIFRGVSIFVDGYTVPPSQELKAYMLRHGGRFENYFSRKTVTHIICSHLPDSKMKNFRSFSRGLPVVKPGWVLDSVAANRLLNWVPYQLEDPGTGNKKQQRLSTFFAIKRSSVFNESETAACTHVQLETRGTFLEKCERKVGMTSDCLKVKDKDSDGSDCLGHQNFCERNHAEKSSIDLEDGNGVAEADQGPQKLPSANPQHSTAGDANFVENYFKSSRLHFIGTWRSRYRKRFLNVVNSAKCNKLDVGSASSSLKSSIIHVDMDCFFVSVVIRNHPEMSEKPVAICHSDHTRGTAEISSANYPARRYGVHAGMLLRDAKVLCPQLAIFPYNFEAYEEVADQFYAILHENCPKVQAVSCDEAFLDATGIADDPEKLASAIRQQVLETTGCTASAGIAGNMLLARLATRSAKPNGQFSIWPEKVVGYLRELPIEALPGIGHSLEEKLKFRNIKTCGQLQLVSKESLQREFGRKTGEMLWKHCRGIDDRVVDAIQEMKTVGAEVNWGVRFNDLDECHSFLSNLCKEVSTRLKDAAAKGKTITLKLKKRREGAGEPIKYMGCGDCENMSRCMTVPTAIDSLDQLFKISKQLFGTFHVDAKEVRGLGLQLSKLEFMEETKQGNTLESWLASAPESNAKICKELNHQVSEVLNAGPSMSFPEREGNSDHGDYASIHSPHALARNDWENQTSILPPMSQLDMDVVKCLPPDILSEMDEIYKGKLSDMIEKHGTGMNSVSSISTIPYAETKGVRLLEDPQIEITGGINKENETCDDHTPTSVGKGKQPLVSSDVSSSKISTRNMVSQATGPTSLHIGTVVGASGTDLMPDSLSQVDDTILQQLPEELKADLLKLLPAHRKSDINDPSRHSVGELTHQGGVVHPESRLQLWDGSTPNWVNKFKASSCPMLKILSETYEHNGSRNLSSCLQSLISHPNPLFKSDDTWHDDALSCWCEFLGQYVELKVKSDVEELYLCFRILKRLAIHSNFLLCVYDAVLPFLQASVTENYGGKLLFAFPE